MKLKSIILALSMGLSSTVALASSLGERIIGANVSVGSGCSGTIISLKHRLVLTNFHCISEYIRMVEDQEVQPNGTVKTVKRRVYLDVPISQKQTKGHEFLSEVKVMSKVIASREKPDDLALLQMKPKAIPFKYESGLARGKADVEILKRVIAVGNPLGMEATVTSGIISHTSRFVQWSPGKLTPYIQYDAKGSFGSSGGALYLEDSGLLIGIPAAGKSAFSGDAFALAIPISTIRKFLKGKCWNFDSQGFDRSTCLINRDKEFCAQARNLDACLVRRKKGRKGNP